MSVAAAPDNRSLLAAAASGDRRSWNALVEEYHRLVWSIVRGFGLRDADAADVVQTTWLRLVENLAKISEPGALGSWLATTARRECLRVLYRSPESRLIPVPDEELDRESPEPPPDAEILREERDRMVWDGLNALSSRCRQLLRLLMATDRPVYAEAAAAMDMPIGSVGPTRQRCLDRLRGLIRDIRDE